MSAPTIIGCPDCAADTSGTCGRHKQPAITIGTPVSSDSVVYSNPRSPAWGSVHIERVFNGYILTARAQVMVYRTLDEALDYVKVVLA